MSRTPFLAAAGAALALALPLQAQTIRVGETVRGELTASDPTLEDASHYDLIRFTGRAGQRVTFTLRSSAFDAVLSFGRMSGSQFSAVDTDDDSGGGTDARVTAIVDEDGEYVLRANSLEGGETGAYTLTAEAGAAAAPATRAADPLPTPAAIALGQTVRGTLAAADSKMEDGSHYDLYRFTGRAGQRVEVTLRSTDFDSYLAVGRIEGGEINVLKSDDDGGGNQDARVLVTLPAAGEYVIRANSLGEGETGAYTLSMAAAPPAPAVPAPQAIRVGQTVNGALATSDPLADDDSHYDAYAIQGNAGDRLRITLRSAAFDAYLNFGRGVGEAFESIGTDDDGLGEGNDARLEVTLPASGQFIIRANTLHAGETGAYTLTVERP